MFILLQNYTINKKLIQLILVSDLIQLSKVVKEQLFVKKYHMNKKGRLVFLKVLPILTKNILMKLRLVQIKESL